MIKFIILTILLTPHYLLAKEYQLEMFFTTNNISMDLPNNNTYIHVSAPAVWKDSNGGFLDLNKRKIVEPPKEILDNCIKYLKE